MGLVFFPRGGSAQVTRYRGGAERRRLVGFAGHRVARSARGGHPRRNLLRWHSRPLPRLHRRGGGVRGRRQRDGGAGADARLLRRPPGRPRQGAGRGRPGTRRAPVVGVGAAVPGRRRRPRRRVPPSPPHAPARRGRPTLAARARRRAPTRHRDQADRGHRGTRPSGRGAGHDPGRDARAGEGHGEGSRPARRTPARPVANDALGPMASRRLLARPPSRPGAPRRPPRRRVALRPGPQPSQFSASRPSG